jgi:hypothetical protein
LKGSAIGLHRSAKEGASTRRYFRSRIDRFLVVLPPFESVTVSLSSALSFWPRLRAFRTALKPRFGSLSLALVFTPAASVFLTDLKR